jgi:hypothetical protein
MPKRSERKLTGKRLLAFQRRSRDAILRAFPSQYAFYQKTGVQKPTLTAWLRKKNPRLPFTSALLAFAEATGVGLDHLLLDDGPEIRGAPAPLRKTAALLHDHVVTVLVRMDGHPAATVRAAFPSPDELLERVMASCRDEMEHKNAIDREVMSRLADSGVIANLKKNDPKRLKLLLSGARLPLEEPVIGEGVMPQTGAGAHEGERAVLTGAADQPVVEGA